MCCIQVVPDLGKDATKTSPRLSGSEAHLFMVAVEVIGRSGKGSSASAMMVASARTAV